ncbi:MAG TPA: adenylate kinase [Candidatus Sulfotelmatobacter sp.]|jgi:adenylate kinase|nr:adenylate kinase [Candidatus Sulfotelmatobacter sp.]
MIIILFGPPGSGKGTQADRIVAQRGGVHIATGDILRLEKSRGTELGQKVAPLMEQGRLVPDALVIGVIEERMRLPDAAAGVVFDGFPRTVPQAEALERLLERRGAAVDLVLVLVVPEDARRERILRRAELDGRLDDREATLPTRLGEFLQETRPVLEHFRARGVRIVEVDGVGNIDDVTQRVLEACEIAARGRTEGRIGTGTRQ